MRLGIIVVLFALLGGSLSAAEPEKIDFTRQIRPLLSSKCFACHGPDAEHRQAGLRLDVREVATQPSDSGSTAIVPGKPQASELIARVSSDDEFLVMPPAETGESLSPEEVELLRKWIASGAKYEKHWSFVIPERPKLPSVKQQDWPQNAIDAFLLHRLEAEGLSPEPEANRYQLIRRVSLDLRGLPPTPEEVAEFVNDTSPDAYEKLVDRFLADPAFGERWARMWLDLARYADSAGYGSDPLRTIWRYRDWVIDAFNRNLPFDQFTIEQLAGDLLPEPTLEQRTATAFHRNTMTNTEGGTDNEEFRVAAVKDRVDTTLQVWMGLTMGCAKCHNHKYDPISQKEYYQFYAFFNQTLDNDLPSEFPTLKSPTKAMQEEVERIDAQIAALKAQLQQPTPELQAEQAAWENSLQLRSQWETLWPDRVLSDGGALLLSQEDGSIVADGTNPAKDTYTVTTTTKLQGITAVRLEVLPDESLPGGGPGRAGNGNFLLSRVLVSAEAIDPKGKETSQVPSGRYVRVELPGKEKMLSLAEVEVFSQGENLARQGTAKQSSTDFEGPAKLAIDGNTNGDYRRSRSVTHTAVEDSPWWEVDLGQTAEIQRVVLWNRTDGDLQRRLDGFRIQLLSEQREVVWQQQVEQAPESKQAFTLGGPQPVALRQAVASFSQQRQEARDLLLPRTDSLDKGWSIAPQTGKKHQVVFLLNSPLQASTHQPSAWRLSFRLLQQSKHEQHNLGRFRLSATTDPQIRKRLQVPAEVLAIVDTPAAKRNEQQAQRLSEYYRSIAPALAPLRKQIADLEKSKPEFPTVPVMVELQPEKYRKTFLMEKGNFLSPGQEVSPDVLAAFHNFPDDYPRNRLGVAKWLVHPANPLTARVMANRFWAKIFGIGIVETEEDFGSQGQFPTHPQLLDWLAVEFRESGWDMKHLIKTMVMSAAYRQSSRVTPQKQQADPRNRLLSRGPRFRLEAEMVRDQALALGGLLSEKMYGPSVYPPQPPGLWRAAFNGRDRKWPTSTGEDRYRRGIYTFWRRTIPYPSMATFDAPSREICTVRRIRTNTPLQAFVTMNDPVYVEAAQALARRIVREGGTTPEDQARFALQLCLVRPPAEKQVQAVLELYQSELTHYRKHEADAQKLATDPLGPLPEDLEPAVAAAWTVIANVLLNLDGVLTKG